MSYSFREPKEPINILTADVAIYDRIARASSPAVWDLAQKYNHRPDKKNRLTKKQTEEEFIPVFDENQKEGYPGGSAVNTSSVLKGLAGDLINVDFVSVTGNDKYGEEIKATLKRRNINFISEIPESRRHIILETAISYVTVFDGGKRNIASYMGNVNQIICTEMFPEEMFRRANYIFLQGSLAAPEKFGTDMVDHILKNRWNYALPLILALPTTAFRPQHFPDYFPWINHSANIVLGNLDELALVLQIKTDPKAKLSAYEKIKTLETLQSHQPASNRVLHSLGGHPPQVGFITDAEDGAYIVTEEGISHIPVHPINESLIVNMLGAGDTSFAGFLFAKLVLGLNNKQCAEFAMALAAGKMLQNHRVLEEPWEVLKEIAPKLASYGDRFVKQKSIPGSLSLA